MPDLVHVIYTSVTTPVFSEADLPQIIASSRRNNERHNVTGILLYVEGSFFQVIEGPPRDVDYLLAKMTRDNRHKSITVIIREAIPRRFFGDTTMSLTELSPDVVAGIVNSTDKIRKEKILSCLDEGRAKKLLRAFADGRWKVKVSPKQGNQPLTSGLSAS